MTIDETKVYEAWGIGEPGTICRCYRWGRGVGRSWRDPIMTLERKP